MSTALVVEDSLTDLEILSSCLSRSGFQVIKARNEEEALDQLDRYQFSIIVLDIVLPGRSGFEICRKLKAREETKNIPIIICSTKGSDLDKFWGMKQGADAYLPKPIDQEELDRTVKQVLKQEQN